MGRRVSLAILCRISGIRGTVSAQVYDLGIEGCRLLSPRTYVQGAPVTIALRLVHPDPEIEIPGEILWAKEGPSPGTHLLGCRFKHTLETRKRLAHVVELLK